MSSVNGTSTTSSANFSLSSSPETPSTSAFNSAFIWSPSAQPFYPAAAKNVDPSSQSLLSTLPNNNRLDATFAQVKDLYINPSNSHMPPSGPVFRHPLEPTKMRYEKLARERQLTRKEKSDYMRAFNAINSSSGTFEINNVSAMNTGTKLYISVVQTIRIFNQYSIYQCCTTLVHCT